MGAVDALWSSDGNSVFTVANADLGGSITDILGEWQLVANEPPDGLAFGTIDSSENLPLWRADFPSDRRQAIDRLASAERVLATTQRAMMAAQARLGQLVTISPSKAGQISGRLIDHSVSQSGTLAAEEDPLDLLVGIQAGESPLSYGLGDQIASRWERAWQTTQGALERLSDVISHAAIVETRVAGQLLGRTVLNWLGDAETTVSSGSSSASLELHRRTVALAFATRVTFLRWLRIILQGAAMLGIVLATPGGALLALPAAYKFVTQSLAEIKNI